MNETSLDEEVRQWLGRFALHWAVPLEAVPKHLGMIEVENRLSYYPALQHAVTRTPIDLVELRKAAEEWQGSPAQEEVPEGTGRPEQGSQEAQDPLESHRAATG